MRALGTGAAALACPFARASLADEAGDARTNRFNDPFVQVTYGQPGCATPTDSVETLSELRIVRGIDDVEAVIDRLRVTGPAQPSGQSHAGLSKDGDVR